MYRGMIRADYVKGGENSPHGQYDVMCLNTKMKRSGKIGIQRGMKLVEITESGSKTYSRK